MNTAIHFVVFMMLVRFLEEQALSNLIAFLIAVTFSFFMNAKYTFSKRPTTSRFLKMVVIMACVSFFSGYIGDYLKLSPILTFIGYSAISYVFGFVLTKFFVFSEK